MTPGDVASIVERVTGECPKGVSLLNGVGNNVVAKVDLSAGARVAKIYFRHPDDPRDRLGTEFKMLTFLWETGVHRVPQPFGMFREESLGLYEYIDGIPLTPADISWAEVEQLITFLEDLYNRKDRPEAQRLPTASDYAPSLAEYWVNVSRRFRRLQQEIDPRMDPVAADFINGPLSWAYEALENFLKNQAKSGFTIDKVLDPAQLTLSPADHGFQNTLRREGHLVFLDFEYAGWDDPAQMIANSCLHPAVPMPLDLHPRFVREMSQRLTGTSDGLRRLRLIYPMLALKWCLILLNEFLKVEGERRIFAGVDVGERKMLQIDKSKRQWEVLAASIEKGFFLDHMLG
ncbi:MAG: phosphotransferase [Elusimicrobia bacterium]|mgnify:CR=1 FL=1|jgi:hypothetical protein|nr:phosphotransferase [Elusimicrobiota bacterium]